MTEILLPHGKTVASATGYNRAALIEVLDGINGTAFTGYLSIKTADQLFLLFIFNGQPYSAGLLAGNNATQLTITNFCARVAAVHDNKAQISLYETDPVLLKSLLVFTQSTAAVRGTADTVNLHELVNQVSRKQADSLIVLESCGRYNFFFFLDGNRSAAYWAETQQPAQNGFGVDAMMLLYASQQDFASVTVTVYDCLETTESGDADNISINCLSRLFSDSATTNEPEDLYENNMTQHSTSLSLKVVEGCQAGCILSGILPCVLGRKDADIIITDPMVSKRHAAIQVINGRLVLIDLHSTNGTTINNESVKQRELKKGDKIGVGQTVLLFE